MWKLVIADDEPKIREGLRNTIMSFDLGIEVCGEAKNGQKAVEVVQEVRPHILLADICMPKLNGIRLIEEINKLNIGCRVIIVTGYDEFGYAREAIHLGVSNYLLKPIIEKELYDSLKQIVDEFSEKNSHAEYQEMIIDQLEKNKYHLQETLFNEWLDGKIGPAELEKQQPLLGLQIPKEGGLLVVSDPAESLKGAVESLFEKYCRGQYYIFTDQYQNLVALWESSAKAFEQLQRECETSLAGLLGNGSRMEMKTCRGTEAPEIYREMMNELLAEKRCSPLVADAQKYIRTHYMDSNIDLGITARAIGSNASYVSRMMKKELGQSFKEFLGSLRINQAVKLMKDERLSLHQIAERVGYRNQHYFSTAFKHMTGSAPSDYRKRLAEKGQQEQL